MKLINLDGEKNPGKNLIEIGVLLMVANFLCAVDIWQSILQGWKVTGGGELFFEAFIRTGESISFNSLDRNTCYITFLSVIFSFLGNKEELVLIVNLFLQLGGVALFYRGVRAYFGIIPSLVTAVICGIISGCLYPVVSDTSMHLLWFITALLFWIMLKTANVSQGKSEFTYKLSIFTTGVLTGLECLVDISAIGILLLSMILFGTVRNTDKKTRNRYIAAYIIGAVISYLVGIFLEYGKLDFNQWFAQKVTMLFDSSAFLQYIALTVFYVYALILVIWNQTRTRTVCQEENTIPENKEKAVLVQESEAKISVQESHKVQPENVTIKETNTQKTIAENSQSDPVTIKEQSEQKLTGFKPIKFIENPLPLPKKHVKKEMNYAFEPSKEQMHYDLNNYNVNDDYDLK